MAGPLLRGSGDLHIVGRHDVMTISDPEGAVHRLLALADGSRTLVEIVATLGREFPRIDERDVVEAVDELEAMGLLQDAAPRGRILSSRLARRDPHERTLFGAPVNVT
jgi:hypothetical protein